MGRLLRELSPSFRPLAEQFLARLTEAKIPVLITCTGRTAEEQAAAIRAGTSKVAVSRHQSGNALDVVPFAIYRLHGPDEPMWRLDDDVWWVIGKIAEDLALRWGGRFGWSATRPKNIGWDPGHVELRA